MRASSDNSAADLGLSSFSASGALVFIPTSPISTEIFNNQEQMPREKVPYRAGEELTCPNGPTGTSFKMTS
jgi:hypothetical protein